MDGWMVRERIARMRRLAAEHGRTLRFGLDEFILSGYPHLEEACWFGEHVIPRLRARGLLEQSAIPHRGAALPLAS